MVVATLVRALAARQRPLGLRGPGPRGGRVWLLGPTWEVHSGTDGPPGPPALALGDRGGARGGRPGLPGPKKGGSRFLLEPHLSATLAPRPVQRHDSDTYMMVDASVQPLRFLSSPRRGLAPWVLS